MKRQWFRIIPPSRNLGCLGFRILPSLYFDFFTSPYPGMFFLFRAVKVRAGYDSRYRRPWIRIKKAHI